MTLGFMVKMSSVRCVASRRSRSEIGIDRVVEDPRLMDVDAVSRDERSLASNIRCGGYMNVGRKGTHWLEKMLPRAELLSLPGAVSTSLVRKSPFCLPWSVPFPPCDLKSMTTSSSVSVTDGTDIVAEVEPTLTSSLLSSVSSSLSSLSRAPISNR
jgi:hypothetical protein